MKAAQPFMLMVVQIGSTKRETLGLTPSRFSAEDRVTGRVAAELLVKMAMMTAGLIARKTFSGFRPRISRKTGRMRIIWITLHDRITAV